jgi:hypothetical protein
MAPSCTVIAHCALNGQYIMKKININGQMRNKIFLIVIYHFSLVKAAMNAARVCKMCNGVKKMP